MLGKKKPYKFLNFVWQLLAQKKECKFGYEVGFFLRFT